MASASQESEHSLKIFAAQYFQILEPQHLMLPPNGVLIQPKAQCWIYENMFNEVEIWPIPPVRYRCRVLKMVLSLLESSIMDSEEDEITEDLMNVWTDLITRPQRSPLDEAQDLSYIKYSPPGIWDLGISRFVITCENRGLILSSGTTGFRTWEAALHLGTYLSTPSGKAVVSGKNIVELGAGTGLISLYCFKCLGTNSVVATDREPALISNIQDCVSRNNLNSPRFRTHIWEWGRPLTVLDESSADLPTSFDVALGADLIYDSDLIPVLVSTLHDLFENYNLKEFLISATLRNQETFTTFLNCCEQTNLHAQLIHFQSPPRQLQDGFFHGTDVPIRTYRIITRKSHNDLRSI
ncbi:hypothetical protein LOZ65_002740 [Ophidiomyces ophidiicola]|nr:hypothetical protein LOZ65_002740 [Ophidiomyces ophidiicola]